MDRQITQMKGQKNKPFNETIEKPRSRRIRKNKILLKLRLLKCKFLLLSKQNVHMLKSIKQS